jgi:hypothetical protein
MGVDKRKEKRISCFGIIAEIESGGLIQEVKMTNITRQGACIDQKIDPADSANVTLFTRSPLGSYHLEKRECQIIEHEDKSHTGIRFVDRLTDDEMDILGLT